jgi:signal transduction histidine kinase
VAGLGIDRRYHPMLRDRAFNLPAAFLVAGFDVADLFPSGRGRPSQPADVIASSRTTSAAAASGTVLRTRRIIDTNCVTVSWVATASSNNVESSARRCLFATTFVELITSRTASKIRSGRPERRRRLRHCVNVVGWNPASLIEVVAADTERARVERDLQDGDQQRLVALGVNFQLAHGFIRVNANRAAEIVAELSVITRNAAEELRSLSHGNFPQTHEGLASAQRSTRLRNVTATSISMRSVVVRSESRRRSKRASWCSKWSTMANVSPVTRVPSRTVLPIWPTDSAQSLQLHVVINRWRDDGAGHGSHPGTPW